MLPADDDLSEQITVVDIRKQLADEVAAAVDLMTSREDVGELRCSAGQSSIRSFAVG
jgi:hypothetical protein